MEGHHREHFSESVPAVLDVLRGVPRGVGIALVCAPYLGFHGLGMQGLSG